MIATWCGSNNGHSGNVAMMPLGTHLNPPRLIAWPGEREAKRVRYDDKKLYRLTVSVVKGTQRRTTTRGKGTRSHRQAQWSRSFRENTKRGNSITPRHPKRESHQHRHQRGHVCSFTRLPAILSMLPLLSPVWVARTPGHVAFSGPGLAGVAVNSGSLLSSTLDMVQSKLPPSTIHMSTMCILLYRNHTPSLDPLVCFRRSPMQACFNPYSSPLRSMAPCFEPTRLSVCMYVHVWNGAHFY